MKFTLNHIFENDNALQPKPPRTHLQLNKLELLCTTVKENAHHEEQGGDCISVSGVRPFTEFGPCLGDLWLGPQKQSSLWIECCQNAGSIYEYFIGRAVYSQVKF